MLPARNLHWLAMFGCNAFLKIIESWLTTPKLEAWLRSLLACDIPSSSAGNSSSFQRRPQPQCCNDPVESPKCPVPSLVNDSGVMHSPSDSVTDGPWSLLWGGPELSLKNIEILLVLHLHCFTKQEWKFTTKNCEATLENSGVLPQALILRGNWALQGYPTSDNKQSWPLGFPNICGQHYDCYSMEVAHIPNAEKPRKRRDHVTSPRTIIETHWHLEDMVLKTIQNPTRMVP